MQDQNPTTPNKIDINQKIHELHQQQLTREQIFKELLSLGFTVDLINLKLAQYYMSHKNSPSSNATFMDSAFSTQFTGVKAILFIAVAFIGLGVISLIVNNWQYMGNFLKFGFLLVVMWISYIGGWFLEQKQNDSKTGNALIILGNIIFGVSIFLIGEMFNINGSAGNAFSIWMLGTFLMYWVNNKKEFLTFTVILGFISFLVFLGDSSNRGSEPSILFPILNLMFSLCLSAYYYIKNIKSVSEPMLLLSVGFFTNILVILKETDVIPLEFSQVVFLVFCLVLLYTFLFRYKSLFVGTLILGYIWLTFIHGELLDDLNLRIPLIFSLPVILMSMSYYFLSFAFEKTKELLDVTKIYKIFSLLAVSVTIWGLSSKNLVESLRHYVGYVDTSYYAEPMTRYLVLIGILIVFLYSSLHFLKVKSIGIPKIELLAGMVLVVLSLFAFNTNPRDLVVSQPTYMEMGRSPNIYINARLPDPVLTTQGYIFLVIFNISILAYNIGLIFLGYFKRDELLINMGVVLSFLTILNKYFDWFSDKLDKSIFFIFTGVLLLGLGWSLERGRKLMLENIHNATK